MPTVNGQLIAGFIWIWVCALAFYWLWRRPRQRLPGATIALAVALLLRLSPALFLPRGAAYEMHVFEQAAALLRAGDNVYLAPVAHPYLPLQLYWFGAAHWLTQKVDLFFIFWLKLDSIILDAGITILVFAVVRRNHGEEEGRRAAWLYSVNPITILVAAFQGQFDAIPLFFLLLALYEFTASKQEHKGFVLPAVSLGTAIWAKTWPVLFLPIAFLRRSSWSRRFVYALLTGLVPMVGLLIYELLFPGSLIAIVRRAMSAGAIPGWWGYSSVWNVLVTLTGQGQDSFLTAMTWAQYGSLLLGAATIWLTRHRAALDSLLLTILVLFIAMPNLGLQGLSWLVPLGIIGQRYTALGWYIAGAFSHMLISYWGLHLDTLLYRLLPELWANIIIQLSSLPAWLACGIWLWYEVRVENCSRAIYLSELDGAQEP